jgi:ribulose-phosphate 3-epimerase
MGTPGEVAPPMNNDTLCLHLGVKSDPIEYRYSYEWLFHILADEDIHFVQIGTFFEIYHLPDEFFLKLLEKAEHFGITIASIFTAHRELGGFFRSEPGFVRVARKNFERLIKVGALLGASSVGSNPGAVMRDWIEYKAEGIRTYLKHMKELMKFAHRQGVPILGIEPMSCLAEPPTLPAEICQIAEELLAYHQKHPDTTSTIGYCVDVSHGYANEDKEIIWDNMQLLHAALPYTTELHIKNTDAFFNSTFGFSEEQRRKGIVDLSLIRDHLLTYGDLLPVRDLICYLEIGGPKTGRDYTDCHLEQDLRASLAYLKEVFYNESFDDALEDPRQSLLPPSYLEEVNSFTSDNRNPLAIISHPVQLAPSMMCTDLCHLEDEVSKIEALGIEYLHMDIMDAHFVPNMPLGLETLRRLRPKTHLPFDAHLMVDNNDFFVRELAEIGVEMISVHVESSLHLDRTLSLIRESGAQVGVALNPATPLSTLEYVLEKCDFILLMTVNPGYAGQKLVSSTLKKLEQCRAMIAGHGLKIRIEVDGNVSFEHIPKMVAAGADILVTGTSSLFHPDGTLQSNLEKIRQAIQAGLQIRGGNSQCPEYKETSPSY